MEEQKQGNFTPLPIQDKQELTSIKKQIGPGNLKGIGGFQNRPEDINKAGRPKNKTITEVIYSKLNEKLEGK